MIMKTLNKLRRILHTLSMGMLFKPHQDPTVCPEHGPMAGCTGRANPDIDPDNEWDTIYYCPECLHEEQEAHLLDSTPWLPTLQRHIASTEPKAAIIMTERSGEERTDIFYEDDDSVIKGWYHKTEDEDMRGPYPTRDEALIELGEYVAHLHMTQDSEKSDNFNWPAPRTDLFATRIEEIEYALKHHCMNDEQRKAYIEELKAETLDAVRDPRKKATPPKGRIWLLSTDRLYTEDNTSHIEGIYSSPELALKAAEDYMTRNPGCPRCNGDEACTYCDDGGQTIRWKEVESLELNGYGVGQTKKWKLSYDQGFLCEGIKIEGHYIDRKSQFHNPNMSEKSDNKALPFKDREPKLMRGIFEGGKACRPWVSPDDPHVTSDPQTYTGEDLLELGIEEGSPLSITDGPQPLRLCGFCKSQLPDIEYNDGINFAWLDCPECKADNWVGGDD